MSLLITPKALKERTLKVWQRGGIHRAWLQKTSCFPLEIPLKSISAKDLLTHFSEVQDAIYLLRQDAKKQGYQLIDKMISHRQVGEQKIPTLISFSTETILLNYLAKTIEFNQFKQLTQQTLQQDALLLEWLISYPFKVMKYAEVWTQLLKVCIYFENNPQSNCYIRQLDIKGVDSKFIEQHKSILNELLTQTLSEKQYHKEITGLSHHGFERRYNLLYDYPLIRFRILDANLAIQGLTDITLPLTAFKQLKMAVKTVFIAENKINGLVFPDYPQAIVVFGLGYSVNLLAEAECLKHSELYYWGDIDTHGYAILSRIRHYYPQIKSLLMNQQTLNQFIDLTVYETLEKSGQKPLSHLTPNENTLYQHLQKSLLRLEQERISFVCLQERLANLQREAEQE